MSKRRLLLPAVSALACLSAAAPARPAQAQGPIEEIIVTARQRAENPRTVPVALSVFTEAQIDQARIDSIAGIATRTPGLVVSDPFGRYNPAPAIRGLTQPGIGEEPSVGYFLDGVYISGRSSINLFLNDLARLEVLKGPQNALFGRNSFSGAVNLVTRKPGDTVEGFVEGTLGTKDRRDLAAALSTPLIPGLLAARASFALNDVGGFYDNPVPGGPEIGAEKSIVSALTLRATPGETVEALLRVSYAEDDDSQWKGVYLPANCEPRIPDGALRQFCGAVPEVGGSMAATPGHWGFRRDAWRSALTVDWDMGPASLTSITAYNAETNEFNRDNDYAAPRISQAGQWTDRWDASQELRLTGADRGQPVTWLAGANFWVFENDTERRNIEFWQGQTTSSGLPVTAERVESWAAYGSVSWRVAPGVTLTGDLRWQRDAKEFQTTSLTDGAGRPIPLSGDWTMWTPRLALSWQAADDLLLYASAAKGAKSGGFSAMANIFPAERQFDPETNWTYELGAKAGFLGGRLLVDAALFHIDWTDQQLVVASAAGTNNNFYTGNAAESRSQGLELAVEAAPADGLSLRAAYALVHARFTDYQDPDLTNSPGFAPDGDVSGRLLPRQSRHQLALSADYERDLAAGWTGFVGGEYLWQSRQYTENTNLSWVPDDGKANAWAGVAVGALRLTARVRNLFDDRTPPVAIRFADPARAYARAWLVTPADGRTWSLTARWSF